MRKFNFGDGGPSAPLPPGADPDVASILGPDGLLAKAWPGYEKRDGQIRLAEEIYRTLRAGQLGSPLVAEAPTGSGKALAGITGLALAIRRQRADLKVPSAILTGTIALQDQLVNKDLPGIVSILPDDLKFTYGVLKGRNQYICRLKYETRVGNADPKISRLVGEVAGWVISTETGDWSEVECSPEARRLFSCSSRDCNASGCGYQREGCWYKEARERAFARDVIVANYHVAFSRGAQGIHNISQFGHVICDEAHEIPGIARDSFGRSLSPYDIRWLAQVLPNYSDFLAQSVAPPEEIRREADKLFMRLLRVSEGEGRRVSRIKRERLVGPDDLLEMIGPIADLAEVAAKKDKFDQTVRVALSTIARVARDASQILIDADTLEYPDSWVYWIEQHAPLKPQGRPWVSLEARPFLVGGSLSRQLFGIRDDIPTRDGGVCLMSATLQTSDGFSFIRREVGAPEGTKELVCRSPFVLATQAALVVPEYVPITPGYGASSREEDRYHDLLAASAAELILALGGRTLCLFTSWTALEAVGERLTNAKTMEPYVIRMQGQAPTTKLVRGFAAEEIDVLLGVASLWQGVDVPGDALKGLWIHKIPFPSPSEPINEAMSESIDRRVGDKASFNLWAIPVATTMLQQGMGRLIRTTKDSGVCVIADRRLTDYGYGKRILRGLPKFSRFPSLPAARQVVPWVFEVKKP